MEMINILTTAGQPGASDIHIVIGKPPMARIRGEVEELDFPAITAEESKKLIYSVLYDEQKKRFEEEHELDCSIQITKVARFRVNVLLHKYGVEAVLRVIPSVIPTPEEIGLTNEIVKLTDLPRGLVLVTGATGSGKSTTLACLIELINQKYKKHILTIEDPIEFIYENKRSIIRQREIGVHTKTFHTALKYALRQDPDVILVGEMRDLETISAALTVAETGHLVFATLHTQDAAQTIDRIIDVFPSHQQQQVRIQLASTLKAVISQVLLPKKSFPGRVAIREIMIVTAAISNLIREGKTHQIYTAIETGGKFGMISLDKALVDAVKKGLITQEDAISKAQNPENVRNLLNYL